MLAAFAELVDAADAGPVADLGCGPGRMTAHMHALGLTTLTLCRWSSRSWITAIMR